MLGRHASILAAPTATDGPFRLRGAGMTVDMPGVCETSPGFSRSCDVLIVDDHPMFVEALTDVLRTVAPRCSWHAVGTLHAAQSWVACKGLPRCVLLDLSLPDLSPAQALVEHQRWFPGVDVVILSGHDDPATRRTARAHGARAFLSKRLDSAQLMASLRALFSGGAHDSDHWACAPTMPNGRATGSSYPCGVGTLSPRQRDILELLALGWSNKEIARHLEIAPGTVKTHVQDVCQRLGARNRTEAARFVVARLPADEVASWSRPAVPQPQG